MKKIVGKLYGKPIYVGDKNSLKEGEMCVLKYPYYYYIKVKKYGLLWDTNFPYSDLKTKETKRRKVGNLFGKPVYTGYTWYNDYVVEGTVVFKHGQYKNIFVYKDADGLTKEFKQVKGYLHNEDLPDNIIAWYSNPYFTEALKKISNIMPVNKISNIPSSGIDNIEIPILKAYISPLHLSYYYNASEIKEIEFPQEPKHSSVSKIINIFSYPKIKTQDVCTIHLGSINSTSAKNFTNPPSTLKALDIISDTGTALFKYVLQTCNEIKALGLKVFINTVGNQGSTVEDIFTEENMFKVKGNLLWFFDGLMATYSDNMTVPAQKTRSVDLYKYQFLASDYNINNSRIIPKNMNVEIEAGTTYLKNNKVNLILVDSTKTSLCCSGLPRLIEDLGTKMPCIVCKNLNIKTPIISLRFTATEGAYMPFTENLKFVYTEDTAEENKNVIANIVAPNLSIKNISNMDIDTDIKFEGTVILKEGKFENCTHNFKTGITLPLEG